MNEQSPPKKQSPPRKLTRSRDDRYVGGVAAGLAKYLNVDAIFVRIAFIASLALGGLGLLVYVAMLALTPIEGDPSDPLPPIESKRRNQMIGLAVIVGVFALFTADSGSFAAWVFGFWPGVVFGVLFWTAAGVGLIWLLASGQLGREPGQSGKAADTSGSTPRPSPSPGPADAGRGSAPSTEVVTHPEAPSQLSTEVMETRQMESDDSGRGPAGTSGTAPDASGTSRERLSAPVRGDVPATVGKIMLWFAIGLAGLTAFCILFVISAGTTALLGGVPMAALVILLGAGMIFAGLRGRRQLSLWLLTAAVAVTIPMAAVAIADLRIEGSYGDINETPLSVVDIPDDGFEMAAGNMTIDLRKFDFDRQRELSLPVKSGMGLTSVIVPDDACVTGAVTGKAGVANIRGRQSNGLDIEQTARAPISVVRGDRPRPEAVLYLTAEFKLGAFEVVDNTQWRQDGRGGSFEQNEFEPDPASSASARDRAIAACSAEPGPDRLEIRKKRS